VNALEQSLTHLFSAAIIAGMLALCLRSRGPGAAVTGRRTYHVHGGWYVFLALGGAFMVGIFAIAAATTVPEDRAMAGWCSVVAAVFFGLSGLLFRTIAVTIDDEQVTARTLFSERSVPLRELERVSVVGLVVDLRMREDARTGKRPRPLTFLAGLRGLGELVATLRQRAGLTDGGEGTS
jgi:hypothetical protein